MPQLTQLRVSNLRNIESADINPGSASNIIFGENGAGKSSLLEAINILSVGRSFRTRKYKGLIKESHNEFIVFGRVEDKDQPASTIGIERNKSDSGQFRVNGQNITSSAELANILPCLVINSQSFKLLEGSPKDRRMFFDWLVFHVKHEFASDWKQYGKCLKQRNNLLRRDKIPYSMLEPWDIEIAKLSRRIESCRKECFEKFQECFQATFSEIEMNSAAIKVEYHSGWKGESHYEAQLQDVFERDRRLGYTTIGPHKAELRFMQGKTPAIERLSRGQQKLLVSALYISEARVFVEHKQSKPVFLIDDLPSELDTKHMTILGRWLKQLESQVFVTGINSNEFTNVLDKESLEQCKMFHVEHGCVVEYSPEQAF